MKSPWNQALGNHNGDGDWHPAGAPPLDWWNIPLLEGEEETRYGPTVKPRDPSRPGGVYKGSLNTTDAKRWADGEKTNSSGTNPAGAPPLDWWSIPLLEGEEPQRMGSKPTGRDIYPDRLYPGERDGRRIVQDTGSRGDDGKPFAGPPDPLGAPPLDWWNIPPGGYEGAHYAVFPPELCIKPIKAMCPERVCRVCGEPSRRITEVVHDVEEQRSRRTLEMAKRSDRSGVLRADNGAGPFLPTEVLTTGWTDCGHNDWRPGVVLDPFGGSGTTALVATGHGRDCILIDLDERNFDLALQRVGPFILERAT